MKKIIRMVSGVTLAAALMLSSCTMTYVTATNNEVGDKTGKSEVGFFDFSNRDFSYLKAAQKGGIDKIGTVEQKTTFLILPYGTFTQTDITVTGN